MKHVPFIESCFTNYAIDYTAYLDTRSFLAANILDAHFIHDIDHIYTTTKNIIVCAGNGHTQHIRNVLQKVGYNTKFSTDTDDIMAKFRRRNH